MGRAYEFGIPKAGATDVVAAATESVGARVGKIGMIVGCRVIGVAGGAEESEYAVKTLGLDACLDHQSPDFCNEWIVNHEKSI